MSNNESFIDEVNEEVRRDQLFGYIRRYGWIAVLAVLILVGAAAWTEYNRSQERASAQANGDAIIDALSMDNPEDVLAELQRLPANLVTSMLASSAARETGDADLAIELLQGIIDEEGTSELYKELALLKQVMVSEGIASAEDRAEKLIPLTAPGRPFALLAKEQLALVQVEMGDDEAAIATLKRVLEDAAVTQSLRERSQQMIVALGGDL